MHRLTPVLLRIAAFGALLLLIWNPASFRPAPSGTPPIVLLDASLSMTAGAEGSEGSGSRARRWRVALDSARAAARGGPIWRFGRQVAAYDSAPPADGASRLGPALEAAARGGEIVIVTDGELPDVPALAPDLIRRPRVIHLPRAPTWDAFVARVEGPDRVTATDTVRLAVSYGASGMRDAGGGRRRATLAVHIGGRRVAARDVALPDSGMLTVELTHPASRIPAGWGVVEVRLEGLEDGEPRDDSRLHMLEVSPEPQAVVLAAPPSWDSRFLAAALVDVARLPLRVFVNTASGADAWRDGQTLGPVSAADVRRALQGARLVVLVGSQGEALVRAVASAGRGGGGRGRRCSGGPPRPAAAATGTSIPRPPPPSPGRSPASTGPRSRPPRASPRSGPTAARSSC